VEPDDGGILLVVDHLHERASLIAMSIAAIVPTAVHLVLSHAETMSVMEH